MADGDIPTYRLPPTLSGKLVIPLDEGADPDAVIAEVTAQQLINVVSWELNKTDNTITIQWSMN